jgi:hypothetical protein
MVRFLEFIGSPLSRGMITGTHFIDSSVKPTIINNRMASVNVRTSVVAIVGKKTSRMKLLTLLMIVLKGKARIINP